VIELVRPIVACTTVDFCHGMLLSEVNNAVDDGLLLLAPMVEDANDAIH